MDLTEFPSYMNDQLFGGENLIAAQMLLVLGVMMAVLLPAFLSRQKGQTTILIGLMGIMFCTAVGWVDSSILVVILLVAAALLATKAGDWIGG